MAFSFCNTDISLPFSEGFIFNNSESKSNSVDLMIICPSDPSDQMRTVLKLKDQLSDYGKELYEKKSLLIMGRGYQYGACVEGAFVSSS